MNTLLLKLILTPTLIGAASLAGRRWGHSISGWLVALPLTTGPITFFLALSHGPAFAASSAVGTIAGGFSLAAFTLTYARLAQRWKWPATLAAACLVFLASTALLREVTLPLLPAYIGVLISLFIVTRLLPEESNSTGLHESLPPRWDIPLRMLIATSFVVLLTGLAPALGPHLTGLLAPFPLFTTILASFAHHQSGPEAAVDVLHGLLMGLFSFASFFFILAVLLVPTGTAAAFGIALTGMLLIQSLMLWLLQRSVKYRGSTQ